MKKVLLLVLAAIFSFAISAKADDTKVCKVSGTTGSVTVNVYVTNAETGAFSVTISNDTTEYVNVSFKVTCASLGISRQMTALARPQMETEKKGSFNKEIPSNANVTITQLNGTKCQ